MTRPTGDSPLPPGGPSPSSGSSPVSSARSPDGKGRESEGPVSRLIHRWQAIPLYLRILAGVVLGVIVGLLLGPGAGVFELPSKLVLRLLGAIAPPLIFLAIVQTLLHAEIPARQSGRLASLLAINTLAAILIGLFVANVVQPGRWSTVKDPTKPEQSESEKTSEKEAPADAKGVAVSAPAEKSPEKKQVDPRLDQRPDVLGQFFDNIPRSLLGPLTDDGKVLGVIVIALAMGIALRRLRGTDGMKAVTDLISILFLVLVQILHWIIEIIPLAIFCVVANLLGTKGVGQFVALGGFVIAVLLALMLQFVYYLVRIRYWSWVKPLDVIRGMRDALVMAFSTASSTATMPVTYSCLRTKVGLREQSASLGALVGANFNNDGTALYEAMAALFVAQLVGIHLSFTEQLLLVVMSVVASVGAAGIPEAGLVTMILVFDAVGLHEHKSYIAVLLAVDWFLDRCRTTLNVMGDVNVSCLLDGREREPAAAESQPELAGLTD